MANPTLYEIRQAIGYRLGDGQDPEMITAAATGGHGTTSCQASALDQFENDFFNDWFLRFYAGTHKDVTRTNVDFAKTNGVLTWSPAVTGNTDATDLIELWKNYRADQINNIINQAIRKVEDEALADKVDESLVVNDILADGLMEVWTNTSTLTNWTAVGTLARESTIKREGTYSAKLTNGVGSAATLTQTINNYPLYAGVNNVKASLYARVATATADRVRLSLTDGVTTTYSDYHDGHWWREGAAEPWLKIENFAVSGDATSLGAAARIESGAAIDAYIDKMWLVCGYPIYEYTIPSGFYSIDAIYQEQSTVSQYSARWDRINPERGWKALLNGSTKKIWFDPNIIHLTSGRKLRIEGQAKASTLTLDADTTPIHMSYLVPAAMAILLAGRREPEMQQLRREAMMEAERERNALQQAIRGQVVDS